MGTLNRVDTHPPGWQPPRTPEQAARAAEATIRAALARTRRWPRRWEPYPHPPADNTPAGDLRAWDETVADGCDRAQAELADPERYRRTCG